MAEPVPDIFTTAKRSELMSRIRGKDTQPELLVRRHLHSAGLRYRLHVSSLPGKPDLVFVGRRICVFVHGCFWHNCPKCGDGQRRPKSNRGYWLPKLRRNKLRDKQHIQALRADGWKVFVIWECEISNAQKLERLKKKILFA
jgi:DNA mismatch endonuclease, patch repair protein